MPDRKLINKVKKLYSPMVDDGKEVKVKWDGGGDECIITVHIDGKEQEYDPDCALSWLLMEVLAIPSVGESFMSGEGVLKREGDSLAIHHQSRVYGASWDHIDMKAPGFDPGSFDWEGNMEEVDKQVEETVVICK